MNPSWHTHVYPLMTSEQVAEFRHGDEKHSSKSKGKRRDRERMRERKKTNGERGERKREWKRVGIN